MTNINLAKVRFSNNSDVLNPGAAIYNPKSSYVDTLGGDDKITGTANVSRGFEVYSFVGAKASRGQFAIASAELSGKADVEVYGIKNEGTINTNNGLDVIKGSAKANISATAESVSQAIAFARRADAVAITNAFASINIKATAEGIDNSLGHIHTGKNNDTIIGDAEGSVSAIALATAVAIAEAPISHGVTAFAKAMATSLAKASITATGINNSRGEISTGDGNDTINATATSSAGAFAGTISAAIANATGENKALAEALVSATAKATDKAIAINNSGGKIDTGVGDDTIIAKATGSDSYGIFGGSINTGHGNDRIFASSFGGGVNIDMGAGNDSVKGFGAAQINGGLGWDTLDLSDYNFKDFQIKFGGIFGISLNNSVSFQLDGVTLNTTGFEQFNFADASYNPLELRLA
ncbi:hypothetical protein H6G33_29145 [Calothrix sp. FACHB-1219]|uniref:hypothetical protein n=1 Tax=unclassified Calothrix TaxID=2619626 RepID=UPI0016895AD8|nr:MULTISPECIES: hypothetical protein [unclassified Calothrix]MBD2206202.1 hypothetical protein [Calothrix sp. FACHB-168]MBD2221047.1 hypothetical protein [Calothrix sp. FACHB-1219]